MPLALDPSDLLGAGSFGLERYARLCSLLDQEVPPKVVDRNLLLATWNIREFDTRNHGVRGDESMSYIAEIVSRFDLVAVQEVRHGSAERLSLRSRV